MEFLFNRKGQHIANLVRGQLHSPKGENIGHYLEKQEIFIDRRGKYLGEVICKNRLMKRLNNSYHSINFGIYGNYGNVGNYGNPGNHGNVGDIGGFEDIHTPWMK